MSLETVKVIDPAGAERNLLAHAAAAFIKAHPAWRIASNEPYADDLPAMVHPQAYKAAVKERDSWQEEAGRLRNERDTLRRSLDLRALHQERDVWFWEDDGEDHPESMSNSMAVVIRADVLRALIGSRWRDMINDPPRESGRYIVTHPGKVGGDAYYTAREGDTHYPVGWSQLPHFGPTVWLDGPRPRARSA